MKDISKITAEDIKQLYSIGESWQVYNITKKFGVIHVKWRKQYKETDIKFNDDGYEYKSTFIHPENLSLSEVKALNDRGYLTAYNKLQTQTA